jgi:geranylgeranylglycerol-phosphate geranylgeranyltransferase
MMHKSIRDRLNVVLNLLKIEDQLEIIISILAAAIISNGSLYLRDTIKVILVIIFGLLNVTGTIVYNQVTDIEIDRINKPYRPLPSKKITVRTAIFITVTSYFLALVLGMYLGLIYVILALANVIISFLYSAPSAGTRHNLVPSTVLVSLGYAVMSFIAGWCIYQSFYAIPWWFLSFLFVSDIGEVLSKDYRDIKGDKKHGVITLPIMIGYKKAATVNTIIYILPFLSLIGASLAGFISMKFVVVSVFCIVIGLYGFSLLFKGESKANAIQCYRILTTNYYIIRVLTVWAYIT